MCNVLLRAGALVACISTIVFSQQQDTTAHEQIEELKGAVEGSQESSAEVKNILVALRKIKFSGYILAQFRSTDLVNQPFAIGQFSGGAFPTNAKNQFQVREGRFKVTYDNTLTQAVMQIDIVPTGVTVKDMYLSLTEPWMQSFGLQMGVFDRPFGFEISYSSTRRESPERSRLFQTLFPGERDLGAKLFFAPQDGKLSFLRAGVGLFNGTGTTANEFDNFKDVIAHIAMKIPFEGANAEMALGVSGYFGKVRNNTKFLFRNGEPVAGVKGFTPDSSLTNVDDGVTRRYLGVDAQLYYDVPYIGRAILRGEHIAGIQPGTATTTVSPSVQPSTALYRRDVAGWYISYVQNIGDKEQVVVKYDVYDPNTNVEASHFAPNSGLTSADIKYSTLGFGFIHHWDANIKFVLYYEIVKNEKLDATKIPSTSSLFPYTDDVRDNVFTFRIQYKF